jgi:peptidoglycan/xylan/chitin deacetylase (PgdA/CDA1 family)
MWQWIRKHVQLAQRYAEPKALVLMYHRIDEPDTDNWDLVVSPTHFEQHLQVLKKLGTVISAVELVEQLQKGTLLNNSIAITFDDGYLDNYTKASSLLIHFQLPATFFIVSGNVGLPQEFWWDELASILLLSECLPGSFLLELPDASKLAADLKNEQRLTQELQQQHQLWRASDMAPPTQRAALFYQLWQHMLPLPALAQQLILQQLRTWAGLPNSTRPAYRSISMTQLHELSAHTLFTIGAHTVTHPALASHSASVQEYELATSRQLLREATGHPVDLLAYPYGSNSSETAAIAAQLGFKAAFTTDARLITTATGAYKLGRFQVNNWDGNEFKRRLAAWFI